MCELLPRSITVLSVRRAVRKGVLSVKSAASDEQCRPFSDACMDQTVSSVPVAESQQSDAAVARHETRRRTACCHVPRIPSCVGDSDDIEIHLHVACQSLGCLGKIAMWSSVTARRSQPSSDFPAVFQLGSPLGAGRSGGVEEIPSMKGVGQFAPGGVGQFAPGGGAI
jgi:hypothetical protein